MKKTELEKYSPQCYESHPALKIGDYKVYGGSASWPCVTDADIYLSLQRGSSSGLATPPWEGERVIDVSFNIKDSTAPDDPVKFKKMIDWLCNKLQDGKKIHVGCIGGHGRTGTVLSALVATILNEKDAITYVRKHYCKKVVESSEQVKFLHKYFGVKEVGSSKSYGGFISNGGSYRDYEDNSEWWKEFPSKKSSIVVPIKSKGSSSHFNQAVFPLFDTKKVKTPEGVTVIQPVKNSRNLWPM